MAKPGRLTGRFHYRLYRAFWSGIDWLYPPGCGGCGKKGTRWCPGCLQRTQLITPPICPVCGQSQRSHGLCAGCKAMPPCFSVLRSWAAFNGPLRAALHRLKYRGDVALGEALSVPLTKFLAEQAWRLDIVAPVPLGAARIAERGYNQAALLAHPLALAAGLAYRPGALFRTRETRSQVGLTAKQRQENVWGAFQGSPELVEARNVLIVDDVTTSGATINACAAALLDSGASQVYGLTLARAVFRPVVKADLHPDFQFGGNNGASS